MAPEVLISKRGGGLQEREDKSRVDWSTPYDEWLVPILNRFRYGGTIECRAIPSEIQLNIETIIRTEKLKLLAEVRERVVGEKKDQEYRLIDTEYASNRKEKVYLSDGISRNKLRSKQRIELAKLEAEL